MPLYSMTQLIDKTLVLQKNMNVYRVKEIISFGSSATPAYVMYKGDTLTVDSYLLSSPAYTDKYNIHYAARKYNYFLFYRGSEYMAIAIIDGAYSRKDLEEQGVLTVKQEADKAAEDAKSPFDKAGDWLGDTFKNVEKVVKVVIVLALIYVVIAYILPALKELKKK